MRSADGRGAVPTQGICLRGDNESSEKCHLLHTAEWGYPAGRKVYPVWKPTYILYVLTILILISAYRLLLRFAIKKYRTKGGNLRFVVLVGSGSNMRELYHELTDQSWVGYRVMGYFDFLENTEFSKECTYLGNRRRLPISPKRAWRTFSVLQPAVEGGRYDCADYPLLRKQPGAFLQCAERAPTICTTGCFST